jgi:hypothetical protein
LIVFHDQSASHAAPDYREVTNGQLSEAGLMDYLVLLSIQQTCEYKGFGFLKFLLSGETDLGCYRERSRVGGPVVEIEMSPLECVGGDAWHLEPTGVPRRHRHPAIRQVLPERLNHPGKIILPGVGDEQPARDQDPLRKCRKVRKLREEFLAVWNVGQDESRPTSSELRRDRLEFGVAETLSKAKNTAVSGLVEAGVVKARAGKVQLLKRDELPDDWNPATDKRLTVWEVTQQLIRTVEKKGESAAAVLLHQLGGMGEIARDLAYRLYTICERKKWADEALAYNGLVIAWSELSKLALAQRSKSKEDQQEMF